jgi:hypothetical protein
VGAEGGLSTLMMGAASTYETAVQILHGDNQ